MSCRNADRDAEVIGDLAHPDSDVARVAEPQLASVRQASGDRLGDQQPGVPVARCDLGGLVEQGPRVEYLEDRGHWPPEDIATSRRERSEHLRHLTTARGVDPLEKPPVRRSGKSQRLIWQAVRQITEQRSDGEVLVNDDHTLAERSIVFGRVDATEEWIRIADRRQRVSKFVGQVARGDTTEDLLVALRQPRVT